MTLHSEMPPPYGTPPTAEWARMGDAIAPSPTNVLQITIRDLGRQALQPPVAGIALRLVDPATLARAIEDLVGNDSMRMTLARR